MSQASLSYIRWSAGASLDQLGDDQVLRFWNHGGDTCDTARIQLAFPALMPAKHPNKSSLLKCIISIIEHSLFMVH